VRIGAKEELLKCSIFLKLLRYSDAKQLLPQPQSQMGLLFPLKADLGRKGVHTAPNIMHIRKISKTIWFLSAEGERSRRVEWMGRMRREWKYANMSDYQSFCPLLYQMVMELYELI
jgi:hypothetical protein